MDYTQAVDKCEPDDLKNDFFPPRKRLAAERFIDCEIANCYIYEKLLTCWFKFEVYVIRQNSRTLNK